MEKRRVNVKELSIILDTGETTLYPHISKKYKSKKDFIIDIDELFLKSKLNNFRFMFEDDKTSFLTRMQRKISIEDYPEELRTKDIIEITGFSKAKIFYMRTHEKIKYCFIRDPRYSALSKGNTQYIYSKQSLIEYLDMHHKPTYNFEIQFIKQFYTTNEAIKYIMERINKKISLKTLYRYIHEYGEVPAIKIGGIIRIPILEFESINIEKVFENFIK